MNTSPEKKERLGVMTEETGKVTQILGRIIVDDAEPKARTPDRFSNKTILEEQIGHLLFGILLLAENDDVDMEQVVHHCVIKASSIKSRLHLQHKFPDVS